MYKNGDDEDATIYGLLKSFIMTGNTIRDVSIDFLGQFKTNYNKRNPDDPIVGA